MDPMSMAVLATSVAGGISDFFGGERQKAFQAAAAEAQIQALQDQIAVQRIQAARKERALTGEGTVAAGAVGVQFTGSIRTATNQAIQDNEFEKLVKIGELKYQQRLQALRAASGISDISQNQIGTAIETIGKAGKSIYDIEQKAATNRQLDVQNKGVIQ